MPHITPLAPQLLELFAGAANASLSGIKRGLEKESLRVTPEGNLAQTDHPLSLGSALTHPHITTDYSEALLEFITQPFDKIEPLLNQLEEIHRFTYQQLASSRERLWPASMPCTLGADAEIPVARYGSSNTGRMKTVYRVGLGHRYGRSMQTIAGIHYNFSLPDEFWRALQTQLGDSQSLQQFKTERYFALIRNFRRHFWLLVYLFGASPAVAACFVKGRDHQLQPFPDAPQTLYSPYATSLRMGDLGYQSDAQKALHVNYNNLSDYLKTLCGAITQSHPDYEAIGLKDAQGEYRQLNTSLLQIENEFYSSIRPKRTSQRGETALQALRLRGVEYVEVRCVDLNPYEPLGITAEQIRVMDAFLLFCILSPSPTTDAREFSQIQENQKRVVSAGRDPELQLLAGDANLPLGVWAGELLGQMQACAQLLDSAYGTSDFSQAVAQQLPKLHDAELTPAAQLLAQMRREQLSFNQLSLKLAEQHRQHFAAHPLTPETAQTYAAMGRQSLLDQAVLEDAQSSQPFDEYLASYYAQYRGCSCGC